MHDASCMAYIFRELQARGFNLKIASGLLPKFESHERMPRRAVLHNALNGLHTLQFAVTLESELC